MTEILFRWVEFLPLVAFLAAGKALDTPTAGPHWHGPFLLGGGLAVLATVLPLWRRLRLNRLALGINLYLIVGAAAFLLQLGWLLRLYGRWQAAGMLAAVVAVGVVTLLWSPQGFIGVAQADRQAIRTYSLYLLWIAVGAFLCAWAFHARPVLSMALPFTALFMGYKLLRAHLTARTGEHPIQASTPPGPMPSS